MPAIFLFILLGLADCKPKLVIDLIRHGASSPARNSSFFPNITWPLSNELTSMGERQMCLLGRLRRHRYIENQRLLDEEYDLGSIYAHSTSTRRALMAAQAYFVCLYPSGLPKLNKVQLKHKYDLLVPPINFTVSKKTIDKLGSDALPFDLPIIPARSVDTSVDGLLLYNDCPYVIKKVNNYFESEPYRKLLADSETWKAVIKAYPAITTSHLYMGMNAYYLADFLIAAEFAGRSPAGIEDSTVAGLKTFCAKVLEAIFTSDEKTGKLAVHELVKEIVAFMDDALSGKEKPKYVLYSGHDVTLAMMLAALKKINPNVALESALEFASNILFELDENGTVKVELNGNNIYTGKYEEFKKKFAELGDVGGNKREGCEVKGLRRSDDYMALPGTIESEQIS